MIELDEWGPLAAEFLKTTQASDIALVNWQDPQTQQNYQQDLAFYQQWLNNGLAADQQYLQGHVDLKRNPELLFPNLGTVWVFLFNYYQPAQHGGISIYAYGRDYHRVIKNRLKKVINQIQTLYPQETSRAFVDSAPVAERTWGRLAGLGFIGKNRCLINPAKGSYFFIATIFSTLKLGSKNKVPLRDIFEQCGTCTRCLDACPTQALSLDQGLDSSKCISYWTIESKQETPQDLKSLFKGNFFGCDICQDVCPWNRFSKTTENDDFLNHNSLVQWSAQQWQTGSPDEFELKSRGTVLRRAGLAKIKQHVDPQT